MQGNEVQIGTENNIGEVFN